MNKNKLILIGLCTLFCTRIAYADYTTVLPKNSAYCKKLSDIKDLSQYALESNQTAFYQLILSGKCNVNSDPIRITVFGNDIDGYTAFEIGSKGYYTYTRLIKH